MAYRDIVVQVDAGPGAAHRAAAAALLARRWDARLTGVFLQTELLRNVMIGDPLTYSSPALVEHLVEVQQDSVASAARTAETLFVAATAQEGVQGGWLRLNGDDDEAMIAVARRTDLTILPSLAQASFGANRVTASAVAMSSGGPVLVTPAGAFAPEIGRRVLIAWKESREAARALRDAWPFLEQAEEVHVLIVSPSGEAVGGERLLAHLRRHGCEARLIVDRSDDRSAADIIRRQVVALGADLLVMGLYGRPRIAEFILGGVSADLVNDPPAALLVSH